MKMTLLNEYIKVLIALSSSRTEKLTVKFYQYRIVEFFTREIDLEFSITQIKERFMKVRDESKSNLQIKSSQGESLGKGNPSVVAEHGSIQKAPSFPNFTEIDLCQLKQKEDRRVFQIFERNPEEENDSCDPARQLRSQEERKPGKL